MNLIDRYGIYKVYETADRDGPVYEVHSGTPATKLTQIHSGANKYWAIRIAKGLAELEKPPEYTPEPPYHRMGL